MSLAEAFEHRELIPATTASGTVTDLFSTRAANRLILVQPTGLAD